MAIKYLLDDEEDTMAKRVSNNLTLVSNNLTFAYGFQEFCS